ncbi:MAG: hypothetical protein ACKV0T_30865 [Planctomycetales bacterium]
MSLNDQELGSAASLDLDARLDAVDQLLLGVLPRSERVALVETLAERMRQGSPRGGSSLPIQTMASPSTARRSKLALSSGILGILSGILLFALPLVYLLAVSFGEVLGETAVVVLLGCYLAMIVAGGGSAVVSGVASLWRLRRGSAHRSGRGWAVAGICTGPVPFGAASLCGLYLGFALLGSVSVSQVTTTSSQATLSPTPPSANAQTVASELTFYSSSTPDLSAVPPQPLSAAPANCAACRTYEAANATPLKAAPASPESSYPAQAPGRVAPGYGQSAPPQTPAATPAAAVSSRDPVPSSATPKTTPDAAPESSKTPDSFPEAVAPSDQGSNPL